MRSARDPLEIRPAKFAARERNLGKMHHCDRLLHFSSRKKFYDLFLPVSKCGVECASISCFIRLRLKVYNSVSFWWLGVAVFFYFIFQTVFQIFKFGRDGAVFRMSKIL